MWHILPSYYINQKEVCPAYIIRHASSSVAITAIYVLIPTLSFPYFGLDSCLLRKGWCFPASLHVACIQVVSFSLMGCIWRFWKVSFSENGMYSNPFLSPFLFLHASNIGWMVVLPQTRIFIILTLGQYKRGNWKGPMSPMTLRNRNCGPDLGSHLWTSSFQAYSCHLLLCQLLPGVH